MPRSHVHSSCISPHGLRSYVCRRKWSWLTVVSDRECGNRCTVEWRRMTDSVRDAGSAVAETPLLVRCRTNGRDEFWSPPSDHAFYPSEVTWSEALEWITIIFCAISIFLPPLFLMRSSPTRFPVSVCLNTTSTRRWCWRCHQHQWR